MSVPVLRGIIWTDVTGIPICEVGENEGLVTAHGPDGTELVLAAYVIEEWTTKTFVEDDW